MANCDVQIKDTKTYRVSFLQNGNNGNAIILGTNQLAYCWDYNGVWHPIGNIYPFSIQVTCDLKLEYNSQNHLIATITNVKSNLSGTQSRYGSAFQAKMFGSISGPPVAAWRSFAIAVSLNRSFPSEGDGVWRKCLGQWWSAGANCSGNCSGFGVIPGGTIYTLNENLDNGNYGAHYAKNNNQTSNRFDAGPYTWDLGQVTAAQKGAQAYVYIQGMEGVTNSASGANCSSQHFRQTGRSSALGFEIPFIVLCPPELDHLDQTDDVCDSNVDACATFKASELGGLDGANLVIEYKYKGQDWKSAMSTTVWAAANEEAVICMDDLIPERDVEWRAKYTVTGTWEAESEYKYGSFKTLFVPSVKMPVPDISDEECTAIKQGKYIEHFTEEYYG